MAITRGSAMAKEQQPRATTLPPPSDTTAEINSNSNPNNNIQQQPQQQQQQQQSIATETFSDYEQTRELRIKENRERLQKLGIVDLSLQLKSAVATKRTPKPKFERKTPLKSPSLSSPPESIRRSSRLQNAPPVTYTEPKEEKSKRSRDIVMEEGTKPEFYTEEHEKLLGNTEMPWTFFVDGYRVDGTRIYDPVSGKTCHQCRQKTLGQRTHCSKCNLVQGQFCGDCLIMRYGEHVVEANQNPDWICPPCRGICNCSLCRHAKGWPATGSMYKRITNLGFKSVAHYLILTKRAPPEAEKSSDAQQSAKRSLPFEGMELPNDSGSDDKAVAERTEINPQSEDKATSDGESDPKSLGGGKSRKKAKKEIMPTSNMCDSNGLTVDELDKKCVVRRSGRNSKNENVDVSEESMKCSGTPGDEAASPMKGPSSSDSKDTKCVVRRSGRKFKNENVDASEESVKYSGTPGDEAASIMKSPSNSDSNADDSVARRLRSRKNN